MSNSLDELLGQPRGHTLRGCRICGDPVEASVQIYIRRAASNGAVVKNDGRSKSRTWSLCADHGVEVYSYLTAAADDETTRASNTERSPDEA